MKSSVRHGLIGSSAAAGAVVVALSSVYAAGASTVGLDAVSYTHLTLPTNREGEG